MCQTESDILVLSMQTTDIEEVHESTTEEHNVKMCVGGIGSIPVMKYK